MARAKSNKIYRNFQKGLITEASFLTYPENSCNDLDNVIVTPRGSTCRRPGFALETVGSSTDIIVPANAAITEYTWSSVSNNPQISFLVQQCGKDLHFITDSASPFVSGKKSFSVDMTPFLSPEFTAADLNAEPVSMVQGKGYLFVSSRVMYPCVIEYNSVTDTVTTDRTYIQVRDFDGVFDGLGVDEEPSTLSAAHRYNLQNQGWVDPVNTGGGGTVTAFDGRGKPGVRPHPTTNVITTYESGISRYPSNAQVWWVAKNTSGDFDAAMLRKFSFGQTWAPKGKYILNAFYKDRSSASGVAGIPVEASKEQPTSVSFFAGRVWYLSGSEVYFSQVLDNKYSAGKCYQQSDPTSEDASELVDTDGGVIPITEMSYGVKLVPAGVGLLVFAHNGVWFISGGGSGFTATTISVQKIWNVGTRYPLSITVTKDGVFWVDDIGIQALSIQSDSMASGFSITTITDGTIHTFFDTQMRKINRPYIKGVYDKVENVVLFLFNNSESVRGFDYNRMLCLNLTIGAFFPHTIGTSASNRITGVAETSRTFAAQHPRNSYFKDKYLIFSTVSGLYINYGTFKDFNFADWTNVNYLSFIETGYELLDDVMRKKGMNYLFTYFRKTEQTVIDRPGARQPDVFDRPSSCWFQAKWNWADKASSGRWSHQFQAYRFTGQDYYQGDLQELNHGFPVIVTRNKVRGSGKSVQFRFESGGIGTDFELLGWAVPFYGNTEP